MEVLATKCAAGFYSLQDRACGMAQDAFMFMLVQEGDDAQEVRAEALLSRELWLNREDFMQVVEIVARITFLLPVRRNGHILSWVGRRMCLQKSSFGRITRVTCSSGQSVRTTRRQRRRARRWNWWPRGVCPIGGEEPSPIPVITKSPHQ